MKPLKIFTIVIVVTFVGLLALSYGPVYSRSTPELVEKTKNLHNMKIIYSAVLSYYSKHRKYPDTLQQLVETKEIEQGKLKLTNLQLHYIKGLEISDGSQIILYTPAKYSGYALMVKVDGSASTTYGEDIEELIAKQTKELAEQEEKKELLKVTP